MVAISRGQIRLISDKIAIEYPQLFVDHFYDKSRSISIFKSIYELCYLTSEIRKTGQDNARRTASSNRRMGWGGRGEGGGVEKN